MSQAGMTLRQRTVKFEDQCVPWPSNSNSVSDDHLNQKKSCKEGFRLLEFHALPDYLKDNEFILRYYRADFSFSQAFYSLFRLHNETVNIWSHFLGFLLFVGLTISMALDLWDIPSTLALCVQGEPGQESKSYIQCITQILRNEVSRMVDPMLNRTTRWPFFVFMGGSMFCLLASSVCHLFQCHSKSVAALLLRIDYAGIAVMIATSFFPPVYYVFQCTPIWQWVYLGSITVMGIATVGVLFAPACQRKECRLFRAMLFMSMAVSGLIPAVHAIITYWHEPLCGLSLAYEALMGGFYVLGTMIYVTRIPERWKPGCFDLGGHSHNLFHIFVIAGAYTHYKAALLFLEWRDSRPCP